MSTNPHRAEREAWIMNWFEDPRNFATDCLNSPFHDAYHKAFPMYAREPKCWGASKVYKAMEDLNSLVDDNRLDKFRMGIPSGNWQPGLPKWVWSYTLPKPI